MRRHASERAAEVQPRKKACPGRRAVETTAKAARAPVDAEGETEARTGAVLERGTQQEDGPSNLGGPQSST